MTAGTTRISAIYFALQAGLMLASLCVTVRRSPAQSSSWTNTNGGLYETASNWSGLAVPPPTNDVHFGFAGAYSVGLLGDHTAAAMLVTFDSHPALSVAGDQAIDQTYTITGNVTINDEAGLTVESGGGNGRFHMNVNDSVILAGNSLLPDSGLITIRDDAVLTSAAGLLGEQERTTGRVLLTGDRTEWNVDIGLLIGGSGGGELTIEGGAELSGDTRSFLANHESSSAVVNVRGVGADGMPSTWLTTDETIISRNGAAELNIAGGAVVTLAEVKVAENDSSQASVQVSGVDAAGNPSMWTTGTLQAGFFGGKADFLFDGGANVSSGNVALSGNGASSAVLRGTDAGGNPSKWTITGEFRVYDSDVQILEGAHLSTHTTNLGDSTGGAGTISLSGDGGAASSTWSNNGDVRVGHDPSAASEREVLR